MECNLVTFVVLFTTIIPWRLIDENYNNLFVIMHSQILIFRVSDRLILCVGPWRLWFVAFKLPQATVIFSAHVYLRVFITLLVAIKMNYIH